MKAHVSEFRIPEEQALPDRDRIHFERARDRCSVHGELIADRRPYQDHVSEFRAPEEQAPPRAWEVIRTRAGFHDVRIHDIRHSFASQAAMQGIPLPVVARLLGHAQVQMTLRYAHVSDRDVEAAAERIGGFQSPSTGTRHEGYCLQTV